ncbi:dual specificity protein phosphatase 16 [Nephila pilipes]|uniref:protein-tyrosine-phosphatase n=1 Tax=Nephila pilipes TaxID=299642 RepID=A0A8X6PPC0_NEPPI|nr:dual specificity protein phosphatase 16 [Nephila pilipes]
MDLCLNVSCSPLQLAQIAASHRIVSYEKRGQTSPASISQVLTKYHLKDKSVHGNYSIYSTAMAHSLMVCSVDVHQLASIVRNRIDNALILDSRSFLEYNASHVINAINVGCAKLMKRRLQQEKLCIEDFLAQNCHWEVDRGIDIIVYDQSTRDAKCLSPDSFMAVFLQKLLPVYRSVNILKGGFLEFQAAYPDLCEDERTKYAPLTSLSQPCLPVSNHGPTRILPFLYLGSQHDALSRDVLQHYNITYQLNVSTSCPKPDFIQDSHFMRIPVIDNYCEKLLPHFSKAFQFLDKVKESSGCVLVHCLAGISRSATVAIAYVMKTLKMTSDEAYRYVKSKRVTISPNFNFLGQLLEFEKQLQRERILDSKSDSSSTPLFNTSSPVNELRFQKSSNDLEEKEDINEFAERTVSDSHCMKFSGVTEIQSFKGTSTKCQMYNKDCVMSFDPCITSKIETYCIPDKQAPALSIKCLPVSSLKELNFTPCQTSFKSSQCLKDDKNLKYISKTISYVTSPTKTVNFISEKRIEKKMESLCTEIHLPDCKMETVRSVSYSDYSSPADLKSFEFDSKPYNRSDSVSTSGIGSEGSDYADSWNDFTSSCERETDILMDDEYPSVPSGDDELHRNKILGFDDSLSLYPKYEPQYDSCHMQRQSSRDYSQAVPNEQHAKKYNMKYEDPFKYSGLGQNSLHSVANSEDLGRAHLLYRAQSCPGMLSSESSTSDDADSWTSNNGVKLRKSKPAKSSKDKCRNRYSCSSIDYMDYSLNTSLSHESCPDALHLSAGPSEGSKISSSHCNYRHSMIQVS